MSIVQEDSKTCTECGERPVKYKKKGLCNTCNTRLRRREAPECTEPNCGMPQYNVTLKLCGYHSKKFTNSGKTCRGQNGHCNRQIYLRGLCQTHYLREKNGLGIDDEIKDWNPQPDVCEWSDECTNKAVKYRVCKKHERAWLKVNRPKEYRTYITFGHQNRRAREVGTHVEKLDPYVLLERDGNLCHYCKRGLDWENTKSKLYRTVEHVNSLFHKGEGSYENARLACKSCNSSKNKKNFMEFMIYLSDKFEAGKLDWSTGRFRDEPLFEPEDLEIRTFS